MLSSRMLSAPAVTAARACSGVSTSTWTGVPGGRVVAHAPDREDHVAVDGREVVVLDQHRAGEVGAVVHAAAAAHGVLLEAAPAGKRLARVDDRRACAAHRRDEAVRERRDAGEVLHEIQRGAFGGEQPARMAREEEHGLVRAAAASPSSASTRISTRSSRSRNAASASGTPAITPGSRVTSRARARRVERTVASVVTSSNAASSSSAARTSAMMPASLSGKRAAAVSAAARTA